MNKIPLDVNIYSDSLISLRRQFCEFVNTMVIYTLKVTFCECSVFRVFVNRSLNMSKIKYIGFDMDYTIAGKVSLLTYVSLCRGKFHRFLAVFVASFNFLMPV